MTPTREQAMAIWNAGLGAVRPASLFAGRLDDLGLREANRLLVVGGGKAGAAMAEAFEGWLGDGVAKAEGLVNVPNNLAKPLRRIELRAARPAGSNHPTAAGVDGSRRMVEMFRRAGPDDVGVCLLSGGGSALLPLPADGVTLADKQAITKLLHECGAAIGEMNCVRKHLSAIKGGRLAAAFRGRRLVTLIISDVVGDPIDAIASGPTAVDPTTPADALDVLDRYGLRGRCPPAAVAHLSSAPNPPQSKPAENIILGNNRTAIDAAAAEAGRLGYTVCDLGSFVEGESGEVAAVAAGLARSIRREGKPVAAPACVLVGGETTVTLGDNPGRGGRNQEFVLALLDRLRPDEWANVVAMSGGTDGEDGPTDAAGAIADGALARSAVGVAEHLRRHDAYPFFDRHGGLIRSGLTGTNVMDLRVLLVG